MDISLKLILYTIIFENVSIFIKGDLIVTLPNGKIRGTVLSTDSQVIYYGFYQIPYAAPPTGNLRFKSPTPRENWEGILDATKNTKVCYEWYTHDDKADEDCLYLNIFTPIEPGLDAKLPVMVSISVGDFLSGSPWGMIPKLFIDHEIVVVTVNSRLGPFGYLSTEDTVLPGNYGLKDQTFALKWIKENIHLFGGDPDKVVLAGQAAGAASVGYQLLSKKAKGLFRGGILQSGTAISSHSFQKDPNKYAYLLAKGVDPNFSESNSTEELLALLQSLPASYINEVKIVVPSDGVDQEILFAPVLEPEHEDAFLTELMHDSFLKGDINRVPIMIGTTSEERLSEARELSDLYWKLSRFDNNISLIVKNDYHINDYNEQLEVGNLIRNIYTDTSFHGDIGASIRFLSDVDFTTSIYRHAFLQSNYTDVYVYEFSYHGKMGLNNLYVPGAERVEHYEEIFYMWPSLSNNYPEKDILTRNRLVTMWTNFVKFLNPTPEKCDLLQNITWPTVTQDNFQYLNINATLQVEKNPKQYSKWIDIIDTYGNPPFNTF